MISNLINNINELCDDLTEIFLLLYDFMSQHPVFMVILFLCCFFYGLYDLYKRTHSDFF